MFGLILLVPEAKAAEFDRNKVAGIMAAYLRHIAALTSWPGEEDAAGEPIRIGVVGLDPNGVMRPIRLRLESEGGLLAQDRPIVLTSLAETPAGTIESDALASCGLIFVSEGAEEAWNRIRPLVSRLPVVTVSEMQGFSDNGGMVEYFVERRSGKVRMKINLEAVRSAGVTLSARLLSLKSVVVVGAGEAA